MQFKISISYFSTKRIIIKTDPPLDSFYDFDPQLTYLADDEAKLLSIIEDITF